MLLGDRSRAHPPQRRLDVLALHRRDHVVRRETELGQPVGVEPDAQRIVERAEQRDLSDAFDPRHRVDDVDGRIVAEINRVVGVLRRVDGDDLEEGGGFLADGEAGARYLLRKQRHCEAGAVLHVDGVDVRIGAERESHVEGVAAVGAAGGLIIGALSMPLTCCSIGCATVVSTTSASAPG